jgi:hypothetical protein
MTAVCTLLLPKTDLSALSCLHLTCRAATLEVARGSGRWWLAGATSRVAALQMRREASYAMDYRLFHPGFRHLYYDRIPQIFAQAPDRPQAILCHVRMDKRAGTAMSV